MLTKERIGALFFLVLSLVYGYLAGDIKLYPGDELDPMTARSLPYVLSAMGIVFSLLLIVGDQQQRITGRLSRLNWRPVLALMAITVLYGLILDWLGFLISTTLFLMVGFRILGEKRIKVILSIAVPFVFIFWFGLTQLLDIYLAPGRLFGG